MSLGLDESDNNKSTLDVYKEYFEKPFLEETGKYYARESQTFLADNTVVEYMKKVCATSKAMKGLQSLIYDLGRGETRGRKGACSLVPSQ